MQKIEVVIPAGSLLTVSTGSYSDYYVWGVFRALKDIDAQALREQWLVDHPEQTAPYRFNADEFFAWVAKDGIVEAVPSADWHLGDYGRAEEMAVELGDIAPPQETQG